jgi:hypothetical protein
MTRADALAVLRAEYEHQVEDLAVRLRPRFEPWGPWDDRWEEEDATAPNDLLADECRTLIASDSEAWLVLAVSKRAAAGAGQWSSPNARGMAADTIALDVLAIAYRRGWLPKAGGPAYTWRLHRLAAEARS